MVDLSETRRFIYQNKLEKWCISLAFNIRIYHGARSSECQIQDILFLAVLNFIFRRTFSSVGRFNL